MTPPHETPALPRPGLIRRIWPVLALFAVLTLALTWPLVRYLDSRLPGTATWAFDESTFVWNIWYFKHALLDLGMSPLRSELIWTPLGIDLILYTYNFFNALLGMPLLLAFSPVVASNVTVLLATFLSALGAYLLALDTLRRVRPDLPSAQSMRRSATTIWLPPSGCPSTRSTSSAPCGVRSSRTRCSPACSSQWHPMRR
jgi:hypothetical protein